MIILESWLSEKAGANLIKRASVSSNAINQFVINCVCKYTSAAHNMAKRSRDILGGVTVTIYRLFCLLTT